MPVDDAQMRRNRLLAGLPEDRRSAIAQHAEWVALTPRDTVFEQGDRIETVYFPLTGVISLVSQFDGDDIVEIATIGNEGMLGLPVFLQASGTSSHMAFCQISAEAVRLDVHPFLEQVEADGAFHTLMHRYTQALFAQVAQNAGCNAVHDVVQRAARWVLMSHDRVEGDEFDLTQEFLAQMLGVRRTAVNAAAQSLQTLGTIEYNRGHMTIADRQALEALACPCYRLIRRELDQVTAA